MTWKVEYAESVRKDIRHIDSKTRQRIREFLENRVVHSDDPRKLGKPLVGTMAGLWRYRVGDYRVICQIQDGLLRVLVVRIAHRRDVYR